MSSSYVGNFLLSLSLQMNSLFLWFTGQEELGGFRTT